MTNFLLAGGTCLALGYPTWRLLARWNILDLPNKRSSHTRPVVRGGGIAVLTAICVVGGFAIWREISPTIAAVALAGLMVTIVSFIDDIRSLSLRFRFAVQTVAAVICLLAIGASEVAGVPQARTILAAAVGFLWITGYTNAFNFMDGVNGLASSQAVITGIGTALVARQAGVAAGDPVVEMSMVVAGAAAGFLPYNFPRARMFLGDVGSAPLGFSLAVLAYWLARNVGWWLLPYMGLLHANFVLDTGLTLGRRIWKRERWLESHRDHFYQRLVRAGKSHAVVTNWEVALQSVVVALVVLAAGQRWFDRMLVGGAVCGVWLAFFVYCEICFQRQASGMDHR